MDRTGPLIERLRKKAYALSKTGCMPDMVKLLNDAADEIEYWCRSAVNCGAYDWREDDDGT